MPFIEDHMRMTPALAAFVAVMFVCGGEHVRTGKPVIPLPAGVWGGMIMLGGAAGVARRLRRR